MSCLLIRLLWAVHSPIRWYSRLEDDERFGLLLTSAIWLSTSLAFGWFGILSWSLAFLAIPAAIGAVAGIIWFIQKVCSWIAAVHARYLVWLVRRYDECDLNNHP